MKFQIAKAIFHNVAPFEELNICFKEKGINVFTGLNGKGKTTIISYIVDALIEFSKTGFHLEYQGKENQYYRIMSSNYLIDNNKSGIVYLRFSNEEQTIDYLSIMGQLSIEEYNKIVSLDNPIPYSQFSSYLTNNKSVKTITNGISGKIKTIFNENILTYFPSYRYEIPSYLNDTYSKKIDFSIIQKFNGKLPNPIEVNHSLDSISTWILDVVLDWMLYRQEQSIQLPTGQIQKIDLTAERQLFENLNQILSKLFIEKTNGVGAHYVLRPRSNIAQRLSIVSNDNKVIAPNIASLSAGEASIIGIFSEIIRQADCIHRNIHLSQITGIALIDEIDKHLHIRLQKEILPKLMNLFPNIQFIITSHSPFLNIGLAEQAKTRTCVFDLDNYGLNSEPEKTIELANFYDSLLNANNNYLNLYNQLKEKTESITKPLIFTEGKTDWKHLKKALSVFKSKGEFTDIDVDFLEYEFDNGDSNLNKYLQAFSKIPQTKKIIGIFDCDEDNGKRISKLPNNIQEYNKNVYGMSIVAPSYRMDIEEISIEFLYCDEDLKKENEKGRRLYTSDEFSEFGFLITDKSIICQNKERLKKFKATQIPKIVDYDVFSSDGESKAMSKNEFANKVLDGSYVISSFEGFRQTFEKIREILILS